MQLTVNFNNNPELLRQQCEAILGVASVENDWSLSGYSGSITLNNNTDTELTQEDFEAVVSFCELVGDSWDVKYFTWNTEAKVFETNLTQVINESKSAIDVAAGATRSKYLTITPGQEATYLAKEMECSAYRAAGYPELTTDYQWVQAEADATGLTPTEAADAILAQAAQWRTIGSLIEKTRRQGKLALDLLVDPTITSIQASAETTITALQAI